MLLARHLSNRVRKAREGTVNLVAQLPLIRVHELGFKPQLASEVVGRFFRDRLLPFATVQVRVRAISTVKA